MEERFVLGIDVGGTNIRAGLVDEQFGLHEFKMEKTANITADGNTVENLIELVKKYLAEHAEGKQVVGISIGFPSTIDKSRRVILSTPNITGLDNLDIVDVMEEKVGIPTFVNKDVNMLMLFDMHHGSIPEDGITTGFYLGTGLGNAISINGELLIGKNGGPGAATGTYSDKRRRKSWQMRLRKYRMYGVVCFRKVSASTFVIPASKVLSSEISLKNTGIMKLFINSCMTWHCRRSRNQHSGSGLYHSRRWPDSDESVPEGTSGGSHS